MNSQIRGLTSIRKGLGKDRIPFLVNLKSIIASENVSGGVQVERRKSPKSYFYKRRGLPIRRGPIFFQIRRGPNPEGSCFHKTGGVPIRRGLIFTISEGSQSGGVLYLLTHRGPNPEGSQFCQSGRVLFLPIRRGIIFLKDLGKQKKRLQ